MPTRQAAGCYASADFKAAPYRTRVAQLLGLQLPARALLPLQKGGNGMTGGAAYETKTVVSQKSKVEKGVPK